VSKTTRKKPAPSLGGNEPTGDGIVPVPKFDADGVLVLPPDAPTGGMDDQYTPDGDAGLYVIVWRLVELLRGILPEVRESLAAKAARDRSRAAAWEALTVVMRSKWIIVPISIATGAISLVVLELAGVDLAEIPAVVDSLTRWLPGIGP
jgi:hypothetical protein